MRILLLGSGGREHALAWKLKQGNGSDPLYIAPGNPGTAQIGKNISLDLSDFDSISQFCKAEKIEMLFVGPEEPLVNGLFDYFKADPSLQHIHFIGPSREGAKLEGSKAFAKEFMKRHGIPTASYREFTIDNYAEGVSYLNQLPLPIVIKADGLAAGKGVAICQNHVEASGEFELMIQQSKFGEASRRVVVEEFLTGIEMSVFAITDGEQYLLLPEAKDYKRIGAGDTGPNTGGMGAISPVPFATPEFMDKVIRKVVEPTIKGLKEEKIEYTGFVFFGIIKVKEEPFVIEYNCRMGDPETEVVMARLKTNLVELCKAAAEKTLDQIVIETDPRSAATIMAVSNGYPLGFEKGFEIKGLNENYGADSMIFQAGTKEVDGKIVTNGGRVLCVTSLDENLELAVGASASILRKLDYDGITYRNDIGYEFVNP
jgi:phosphoribosylamine--glycine ligase